MTFFKVFSEFVFLSTTKHRQFINNEKWQKEITNNHNTIKFSEAADVNCECYTSTNFGRQTVSGLNKNSVIKSDIKYICIRISFIWNKNLK